MYPTSWYAIVAGMEPKRILHDALLNAPALAKLSGVSVHTVRAILAGKRERLYAATRTKLADAMRRHSDTLAALADELERGH